MEAVAVRVRMDPLRRQGWSRSMEGLADLLVNIRLHLNHKAGRPHGAQLHARLTVLDHGSQPSGPDAPYHRDFWANVRVDPLLPTA